jgi:ABC-type transport system involved in multi-copper enzyme maturation permease subunit
MSILTIARDQAADLLRRRYLIVILIGSLALIAMFIGYLLLLNRIMSSPGFSAGNAGANPNMPTSSNEMKELALGGLQMALHGLVGAIATMLALGLMCFSVASEVSKGTVRMILSRPVRRYEFYAGKWLGSTAIVFVYSLLMGAIVCTYTYYAFGKLQPLVPLSMAMLFLKAVTVGSIGMALAMLMRPVGGLLVAYLAAGETFLFISQLVHGHVKVIMHYLFYILPSYKAFDAYKGIMMGVTPSNTEIAYRVAYAVVIWALMFIAGASLFQRRDLV